MSYTLIGSSISPFVRKVMVTLIEKGIEFENEQVNPFAPPEGYRDVSPLGLIPAFRHDDRVINDSSVMCRYIERLHPEPALYPSDPYDCARAEWIEEYMDSGFQPVASRVFGPLVLRPMMSGEEPDETEPQRVIKEEIPPFFDYLASQLGGSEYFVGDALSIADITVGCLLVNSRLAGVVPDRDRWPKLAEFTKRMHSRDSFQTAIQPVVAAIGKRWVDLD
jgi:glutathione S-transferase